MDLPYNFPAFSILLSLLGSGIGFAIKNKKRAMALSLTSLGLCFFLNLATLFYCLKNGPFTYMMGHFPAPWGNELFAGVAECLIACCFNLVLFLTLIGGRKELELDIEKEKLSPYFVMVSLVNASLLALIYTNDIFTGYVFIEICTIASVGLLIVRGIGRTTLAATRYMIFSLLGSGLFLLGIILLYSITGHLLMPNILGSIGALWASGEYRMPLLMVIGLIAVSLAIKSGMFPFYFWMPDTYGNATAASAGILSGVISKGYIFLLMKLLHRCIGVDVFFATGIHNFFFVCGICGILFGSIAAMKENDINRMNAFSSAAQIGYIYMGIGLSTTLGMVAAIFHILAHSITKPMLFLSSAKLAEVSGGSRKFHALRGAGIRNKIAGFAFTMGALSLVGIPGFIGFSSKLLFAQAGLEHDGKIIATLAALAISTVLNAMYFLRTVVNIYSEKTEESEKDFTLGIKPQLCFFLVSVCFIAVNLIIGLHSEPFVSLITLGLA